MRHYILLFVAMLFTLPINAHAYIGPGIGLAFLGSVSGFLGGIIIAISIILMYPMYILWKKYKERKKQEFLEKEGADNEEPKS